MENVLAFLYEIFVLGRSFEEHLQNLSEVLLRLNEYGLKLKPKMHLVSTGSKFFGQECE